MPTARKTQLASAPAGECWHRKQEWGLQWISIWLSSAALTSPPHFQHLNWKLTRYLLRLHKVSGNPGSLHIPSFKSEARQGKKQSQLPLEPRQKIATSHIREKPFQNKMKSRVNNSLHRFFMKAACLLISDLHKPSKGFYYNDFSLRIINGFVLKYHPPSL